MNPSFIYFYILIVFESDEIKTIKKENEKGEVILIL